MNTSKIRSVKREIRVVGIDDGYFVPHTKGDCIIIGAVFRGGYWFDGVMRTKVEIDGMDATEKIGEMIISSPHYGQLRAVLLDGVTFAGFNIVNTLRLYKYVNLPIIAITREKPNFRNIREALKNLNYHEERWKAIHNVNQIIRVPTRNRQKPLYIQITGIDMEKAKAVISNTSTRSNIPEALRVAHLIASGLTAPW